MINYFSFNDRQACPNPQKQPLKSATYRNVYGLWNTVHRTLSSKPLSFHCSEAIKGMVLAGESEIAFIKTGMPWSKTMEKLEEPVFS